MQLSYAVYFMAGDAGEMGHTDPPATGFIDQGHAGHTRLIPRPGASDQAQETAINLVDDLEMPWQNAAEQFHRPGFQGL